MVSDWIIIGAMLTLGAVVVLFLRSAPNDDMPGGPEPKHGAGK